MKLVELDVVVNGVRLHVYRTQTGKRPLVFAHGITDNGLCFLPIAEALSDEYEIVLYDSRGHGKSGPLPGISTTLDRARDLAGLVDGLELKKPGLIGHSLGAVTVGLVAGLRPDLPGCVVLEDPPTFEMFGRPMAAAEMNPWREMAAQNKQKSIDQLIAINREENPKWSENERSPWAQSKQQIDLAIFDEQHIDAVSGRQLFSQIQCPTLILTGDISLHSLYPLSEADALAASLPSARHMNIPRAGHSIRRDQPEAYMKAVEPFLREFL